MTHLNGTALAVIEAAQRYMDAGRSVIPDHPIEKYPVGFIGWQVRSFTLDEIEERIDLGWGIGIRMDGTTEGIDLDAKHWIGDQAAFIAAYEALVEDLMPGLLARLVIERTKSGGRHYAYTCSVAADAGNQKLAERKTTEEERARKPDEKQLTLIETRGTGGQFVVAPHSTPGPFWSVH